MIKILWNIYAWPLTLLIALAYYINISKNGWSETFDLFISLPSLVALHLYIWRVKIFKPIFWKWYSCLFIGWEVYFLFFKEHNISEEMMKALLTEMIFLIPLYTALFRYSFEKWEKAE